MNAERIRAAAEWVAEQSALYATNLSELQITMAPLKVTADTGYLDAALILGKLAAREWVLCEGRPAQVQRIGPSHYQDDVTYQTLHARITEEP